MNTEQLKQLEKDLLWSADDNLRANTDLKSSEYATTHWLIFLKFAENNLLAPRRPLKLSLPN